MKLKVCYDCYHVNANGSEDVELSYERGEIIYDALAQYEGTHLLHNTYVAPHFVNPGNPCDICRSPLGGDRFTIIAEEI
jgi:hypothetical protein